MNKDAISQLDEKLSDQFTQIGVKISRIDIRLSSIEDGNKDQFNQLNNKLDNHFIVLERKLEEKFRYIEDRLGYKLDHLDSELSNEFSRLRKQIDQSHSEMKDTFTEYFMGVRAEFREAKNKPGGVQLFISIAFTAIMIMFVIIGTISSFLK